MLGGDDSELITQAATSLPHGSSISPEGTLQAQESEHSLIQLYVGRVNSRAGLCTAVMLQVGVFLAEEREARHAAPPQTSPLTSRVRGKQELFRTEEWDLTKKKKNKIQENAGLPVSRVKFH